MNIEFYIATVIVCFVLNTLVWYLIDDLTIGAIILCLIPALLPIGNVILLGTIFCVKLLQSIQVRRVIIKRRQ